MAKSQEPKDAQRVRFIAPYGSRDLYAEVAALEGLRTDWWISGVLHAEALRVLEAHGRSTDDVPPPHLTRPPRLQPPMKIESENKP